MKGITKIKKQSLSDSLAAEIQKYITKNKFKEGDRLPSTTEMAKDYGVGVPTLREAIKKLETQGFIDIKHGSGIYIKKYVNSLFIPNPIMSEYIMDKDNLMEIIEIQTLLEKHLISKAVGNISKIQIMKLGEILANARESLKNKEEYLNHIENFYRILGKSAGNFIINELVEIISSYLYIEVKHRLGKKVSFKEDFELECMLFNAIKVKDIKQALEVVDFRLSKIRDMIRENYKD